MNLELIRVNHSNKEWIQDFLNHSPKGCASFRYFEKRPIDIIENHLVTLILADENIPVAYGHLDPENGKTWLGIAVADDFRGKGIGMQMMKILEEEAMRLEIPEIHLAVDLDNEIAQRLYHNVGFEVESSDEQRVFMKRSL